MYRKKGRYLFIICSLFIQALCAEDLPNSPEEAAQYIKNNFGYETKLVPDEKQFRELSQEELVMLNNVLKDLPPHFRNLSQLKGFTRFTRRQNGYSNPDLPDEPSVAHFEDAYIELTDETFNRPLYSIEAEILRLIGIFYYRFVLPPDKTSKWDNLSEWTLDRAHKRWLHKAGNFSKTYDILPTNPEELKKIKDISIDSPSEDFSYAFSFYVTNPTFLKSQSLPKYNFIKEVFGNYEYDITAKEKHRFFINSPTPDLIPPQMNPDSLVFTPHHTNIDAISKKTTSVDAACEVWDEEGGSGINYSYITLLSPDSKKLINLNLQGGIQKLRNGQWQLPQGITPGMWVADTVVAYDKANNAAFKKLKNIFVEVFNAPENVSTSAPSVDLNNMSILVSEPSKEGEITVKIIIKSPPPQNNKLPSFNRGTCVSPTGKLKNFQWGEGNPSVGVFTFIFKFSTFDEKGPWFFSQFEVSDENGNMQHHNLPKEDKYQFFLQQKEDTVFDTDTEAPSLQEDSIQIEVVDKNKNGTGIEVHIRFTGPKDKSGLFPTGNSNAFIRSPSGKRANGRIEVKATDDEKGTVQYEGVIRLPDHPENGIDPTTGQRKPWLLEEIQLQDRAGNLNRMNFLQRNIKIEGLEP